MITIFYKDAYHVERQQEFDNLEAARLAFAGCLTLPDYYLVTQILRDGTPLDFQGRIGDLYQYLQSID
ncbi:DUF4649 family protein [Streptococcus suis]|uniref:DUF4649 family protein n=1 Tax=Streptococcus parasuis TaxID=1501662 RepID=UPI0015522D56|nr:DUF4649 family protein [Streptococcus suis]